MAKCSICNRRKGKRKCKVDKTMVCSLCCGQSREPAKCTGCSFYKDVLASRNYRKIPYYEVGQMAKSADLQNKSEMIESLFCRIDLDNQGRLTDKNVAMLLELYFDKYHFQDAELVFGEPFIKEAFGKMVEVIDQDLLDIRDSELVKIVAAIYRSMQRRTAGGREYLQFIQQCVGVKGGAAGRLVGLD